MNRFKRAIGSHRGELVIKITHQAKLTEINSPRIRSDTRRGLSTTVMEGSTSDSSVDINWSAQAL
jgi:hypothetical protein